MTRSESTTSRAIVIVAAWLASCIAVSAAALKFAPAPWALILVFLAASCILAFEVWSNAWARAVALNLAVLSLTLAAYETWLWRNRPEPAEISYSGPYRVQDDLLGTRPEPGAAVTVVKRAGGRVVYRAPYTIGKNGLRIAPPDMGQDIEGCAVFFGCSFTFGEGVRDAETMPYRVGVLTNGRYRTYNFGFHAYGPAQMLAALESGFAKARVRCRPTNVIYQALPDHVRRAAGLTPYGRHGPRYLLDAAGEPFRAGNIDDDPTLEERLRGTMVLWQFEKFMTIRQILEWRRPVGDEDVRLAAAIVRRSRDLAAAQFPGARFDVLYRPDTDTRAFRTTLYTSYRAALAAQGLALHDVEQMLPGYEVDPDQYQIPGDPHPAPLAQDLVARYVVRQILGLGP